MNKKLLSTLLLFSLFLNVLAGFSIYKLDKKKDEMTENFYERSTNFVGNLKAAVASLESVTKDTDMEDNISSMLTTYSSLVASSSSSVFFDLSVQEKYGLNSHFSTTVGIYEQEMHDIYIKALENRLTNEDWERTKNIYEKMSILVQRLDIDSLIKANKKYLVETLSATS
ncbi:hypothetical protein [Paenibacillus sp. MMO-177]|uniref:hypothetical protein n=1 Tax=Paenibacillus sp. MMO-177 TaxID=3081289 RepID=UPI0030195CD8